MSRVKINENLTTNELIAKINEINSSKSIKSLDISNNNIEIVDGLFELDWSQLVSLKIDSSRIKTLSNNCFDSLSKLKKLYLRSNFLTDVNTNRLFEQTTRLQKLSLKNNQIDFLIASSFVNLQNLTILDLNRNYMSEFNNITLRKLIVLNLKRNRLISFKNNTLPQLKTLLLSFNELKLITSDMFQALPKLETLYLDNNKIINVFKYSFSNLVNLKTLKLNSNSIVGLSSCLFNDTITLNYLSFKNNCLKNFQHVFTSTIIIKKLDLSKNYGMKIDDNSFPKNISIRCLKLNDLLLGLRALPNLYHIKNLQKLYLRNNNIVRFPDIYFHRFISLQKLIIDNNSNQFVSPAYHFDKILEQPILKPFHLIIYLSMNRCEIEQIGPEVFVDLVYLRNLNLAQNLLTNLNENMFCTLYNLRQLNLSGNAIEHISKNLLRYNKQLTKINLRCNKIRVLDGKCFDSQCRNLRLKLDENCDVIMVRSNVTIC